MLPLLSILTVRLCFDTPEDLDTVFFI